MRFVVLGATGRTGRQVVERALARGHSVTAVVRGVSIKEAEGLRVVVANPCNPEDLVKALADQDAVISCLGQRPGGDPRFVRDAARALLEASQKTRVRRYLMISGALLYPSLNPFVLLLKRLMASKLMDAGAAETLIYAADLDWTIVRPPHLREGSAKGYRIETGPCPRLTWGLQFQDLADSLLDLAEGDCFARQIVGVASC